MCSYIATGENKLLNVFGKKKHERYKTIFVFPFYEIRES